MVAHLKSMGTTLKAMNKALLDHLTTVWAMWIGYIFVVSILVRVVSGSNALSLEWAGLLAIAPTVVTSLIWWFLRGPHELDGD